VQVPRTEDTILFWSIIRHIRDFIHYDGRQHPMHPKAAYVLSYEWIVDGVPLQWGDSNLVMTFSEALEMLGVAPENIPVIRDGLISCVNRPRKVRSEICKRIYTDLSWQNNDPEPLWVNTSHNIPRAITLDEV